MRFPEAKIKEALQHADLDLRDAAVRYFYSSTAVDETFMPLAIEAIERYGRINAFSYTHYLNVWPQTQKSIKWVIAELQSDLQDPPMERYFYYLNLSRLLCHTDIRQVVEHAAEIMQAPHLDPKQRLAFRERLDMVGWNAETCWNALRQHCEAKKHKNDVEEFDLGHPLRIIQALAGQPHEYQGQILAILSEQVQDSRHDARKWLQPMMANLAGEMRLQTAVPLLVGKLGHPDSFLSDQSLFALAQIGTESVVTAVCDSFPLASRDFRHYASDLLSKIHSDLTVQRILGLLPGESDLNIRINLCIALLDHFSSEGIEPARQMIQQYELTPDLRQLRSSLIATAKLMGIRFPEFDEWQEQARNDALGDRQRMNEFRQLVYEAGGDAALVVNRLKADIARRIAESQRLKAEIARNEKTLADRTRQQAPRQPDGFGASSSRRVQVGRNDPCPCRSGKKFKQCCMKKQNDF